VVEANSCSTSGDAYPFPSPEELSDELWFKAGKIKVAALGPVDWGNTGNYLVDPPVGFWPEYFGKSKHCRQIVEQHA
jgi:hypothetical protein